MAAPKLATIASLPDELIIRILEHTVDSPLDLFAFSLTCRKFHRITQDESIWRAVCRQWTVWLQGDGLSWREQFLRRCGMDRAIDDAMDAIINKPQLGRIARIEELCRLGYEARDALLKHIAVADNAEDCLARRWWANAVLKSIHRWMAINNWNGIVSQEDVPLEVALASFDMFVRSGDVGNARDITHWLDRLASDFKREHPAYSKLAPRPLALKLVEFMNQNHFAGVQDGLDYYRVKNNFIGMALEAPGHEGMPLIYTAIFCALGKRLGLESRPTGFPIHVYAMVYPPKDADLDGKVRAFAERDQPMYLDVFKESEHEVSVTTLRQHLRDLGIPESEWDEFLGSASVAQMVLRTGRNILNCINTRRDLAREGINDEEDGMEEGPIIYALLWMGMVFGGSTPVETLSRRRTHLGLLSSQIEHDYPWDVDKMEKFILPMFEGRMEYGSIAPQIWNTREADKTPPTPCFRPTETDALVKHKVGTLFKHKRFGYEAVIIGWNTQCDAADEWQIQNRIDRLDKGADQPFYRVL
jgi:F-box protein 21